MLNSSNCYLDFSAVEMLKSLVRETPIKNNPVFKI